MAEIALVVGGGVDLFYDTTAGKLKVRGLPNGDLYINAVTQTDVVVPITDKAAGGNIGTAAATVDVANSFDVNQTTASQTLTLPSPTVTTTGREVSVSNVGSTAFTMLGASVAAGGSLRAKWTGAAWSKFA